MVQATAPLEVDDTVAGRSKQELEVRGRLVRLTRHAAVFDVHETTLPIKLSDVFPGLTVRTGGRTAYDGRAVVTGLVDAGSHLVCETRLEPDGFTVEFLSSLSEAHPAASRFVGFLDRWHLDDRAEPAFKLIVAELVSFLTELRRWTEELELGESSPLGEVSQDWRQETVQALAPQAIPALNHFFARYESVVESLDPDTRPLHRRYVQRRLHPLVLSAPFAHRTYHKPRGYAGDYEMVNMIMRDPREGPSLFAQLLNAWLLQQDSAVAHRNRIHLLIDLLVAATARAVQQGRRARIYNLGCGPAFEVQYFLERSHLSNHADFVLADFDPEALACARRGVEARAAQHGRRPGLLFQRKSIRDLLREVDRHSRVSPGEDFDLIYCAGLFDYLPDATCRQFIKLGYQSLRPGGHVICTNVAPASPNRGSMELILDWHLHYRDAMCLRQLVPAELAGDGLQVNAELTGSNLFLDIVKPHGG
jgi:extracellular factor (EF) 3-hydroxypalmitic acid methyl ester biosynthesis protein